MVILSKKRHPICAPAAPRTGRASLRSPGWTRIVASVAALALLTSCGDEKAKTAESAAPPPVPVTVIEVTEQPTNPGLTFVGRVQAIDNVNLIARVTSFLNKRLFTEGQAVKSGDLLFVLEKDNFQAVVDSAQANLEKAQVDADNLAIQAKRAEVLVKERTISQATLDDRVAAQKQAEAVVQQARASLQQAEINLGYTEIRAPFGGRIGTSNYSVGALVSPTSGPLATIVSQDPIYVTFPVSDRTILEVTGGNRASATTSNIAVHLRLASNLPYPEVGTIDFTGIKVDPATDTVTIRAKFPNPKNTLLDGQFVQVFTESKSPVEALLVPQKAVLTDQSGNFVFTVGADNKVVQRQITQGQTFGSNVVVQSGLKAGDMVVTEGLQRIRPGQLVAPEAMSPPASDHQQPTGN
ncbi:efflux RND transporter periplasmic adaptor subunit [Mesorhizobium sp. ANAO-SY3R2]|uniref:efflux RND transporter periplasmic adaptor subunit n=1 Tax=Mesorhizobium sp. ANAO-SY3R2 TaxID=3166644 RepID=UPI00366EBE65